MIPEDVQAEIRRRIALTESEHRVRVLLAIESGSRAWGFASPNSDYDVRFIYVHERDWYLSIDERRDVIERPIVDDIDLNGWDLRKALRLFRSSNPGFVEWIQSPIIYLERGVFLGECRRLLPEVYSCLRGIHHYRSMAQTNFRTTLLADQVPLKKYFYVLRALLAARWLETRMTPAPIEFQRLLPMIADQPALLDDIDGLLELKRGAPEMGLGPRRVRVQEFIEAELSRTLEPVEEPPPPAATKPLNALFLRCLDESG